MNSMSVCSSDKHLEPEEDGECEEAFMFDDEGDVRSPPVSLIDDEGDDTINEDHVPFAIFSMTRSP